MNFENIKFDFEKFAGPSRELSQLTVKSLEDLSEIQVKNITEMYRIGLESMKAATQVSSPEAFKDYVAEQTAVSKTLAESYAADWKSIGEISQKYVNESKKIVESSVASAS